jgi:hypothetical protein
MFYNDILARMEQRYRTYDSATAYEFTRSDIVISSHGRLSTREIRQLDSKNMQLKIQYQKAEKVSA